MNGILTAVAAIIIFAVLIFVHELGHFIAAKASGVYVIEFALGMGPKIVSKKWGETVYSLRLFPIGGFCSMEGEDVQVDSERSFSKKKPYKRLIILVAGALMNILLGFVLLVGLTSTSDGFIKPQIEQVTKDSAAESSGLIKGDRIVRVNGRSINIMEDFNWEISNNKYPDGKLNLVLENSGKKREVSVVPKDTDGKKTYGITLATTDNSFFETVKVSYYRTVFYSRVVIDSLFDLVTGKASFSQVSGPVGIVHEIGNAVETAQQTGLDGIKTLISLTILLTINLGVFNLLPLPALDGGRILFVLLEMIRRKPIPIEKEAVVHFIGIVLLLGLSVIIAFKDIFTIW
ncbi:MAG: site-2 protease family protein [Clostridia bacterium]|nr:site-2 protease family protein [Clostridia bacterium]